MSPRIARLSSVSRASVGGPLRVWTLCFVGAKGGACLPEAPPRRIDPYGWQEGRVRTGVCQLGRQAPVPRRTRIGSVTQNCAPTWTRGSDRADNAAHAHEGVAVSPCRGPCSGVLYVPRGSAHPSAVSACRRVADFRNDVCTGRSRSISASGE